MVADNRCVAAHSVDDTLAQLFVNKETFGVFNDALHQFVFSFEKLAFNHAFVEEIAIDDDALNQIKQMNLLCVVLVVDRKS